MSAASALRDLLLSISIMCRDDSASIVVAAFCTIARGDNLLSFPPAAVAVGPRVPTSSNPNEDELLPAEFTSAADAASDDVAGASAAPAAVCDDMRWSCCLFISMISGAAGGFWLLPTQIVHASKLTMNTGLW